MDNSSKKPEARRLRIEQRASIKTISKILSVPKSTLSLWLRDIKLSNEECSDRQRLAALDQARKRKKPALEKSKYALMAPGVMNSDRKGRISEAAIAFRLALLGVRFYTSPFDGDYLDFLVEDANGKNVKVQVRSVKRHKWGNPVIKLHRYTGFQKTRRMLPSECDVMVGYDIITDNAYIFKFADIKSQSCVTVTDESKEKWELVTGVEPV